MFWLESVTCIYSLRGHTQVGKCLRNQLHSTKGTETSKQMLILGNDLSITQAVVYGIGGGGLQGHCI